MIIATMRMNTVEDDTAGTGVSTFLSEYSVRDGCVEHCFGIPTIHKLYFTYFLSGAVYPFLRYPFDFSTLSNSLTHYCIVCIPFVRSGTKLTEY
jgi:hypothetical protein